MRPLGRKQTEDNSYWAYAWGHIDKLVTQAYVDDLIASTLREMEQRLRGRQVALAWSGGKDSQVVRLLCELLGIERSMLAVTNLEYPAFVKWVEENKRPTLAIVNTGYDLPWLADNLHMLFPQDAATAARWYKIVQHTAQTSYFREQHLDALILGRRTQDGNFTGTDGEYTNKAGITRYSPIRAWRHEDVMACCFYQRLPLPPIYQWPNGWVVGTGVWPARQWVDSVEHGWLETWWVDPDIVQTAAPFIPSAQHFLEHIAEIEAGWPRR